HHRDRQQHEQPTGAVQVPVDDRVGARPLLAGSAPGARRTGALAAQLEAHRDQPRRMVCRCMTQPSMAEERRSRRGSRASRLVSMQPERSAASPAAKATILVVDDEDAVQRLLAFPLEREGYRVLAAEDGERGLELASSERPDLILLDVMLPGID